jgi:hypothetical protein
MKILEEPLRFDALIVVKLRAVFCLDGLKRFPVSLDAPADSPFNRGALAGAHACPE